MECSITNHPAIGVPPWRAGKLHVLMVRSLGSLRSTPGQTSIESTCKLTVNRLMYLHFCMLTSSKLPWLLSESSFLQWFDQPLNHQQKCAGTNIFRDDIDMFFGSGPYFPGETQFSSWYNPHLVFRTWGSPGDHRFQFWMIWECPPWLAGPRHFGAVIYGPNRNRMFFPSDWPALITGIMRSSSSVTCASAEAADRAAKIWMFFCENDGFRWPKTLKSWI